MSHFQLTPEQNSEVEKLVVLIHQLNQRGHNLATSGNYSLHFKSMGDYALVSESGIDKAKFQTSNFLQVHLLTKAIAGDQELQKRKSSDETAIHLALYQASSAGCVLHSHFMESLLFAKKYPGVDYLELTGLEMLKAFQGVKSHHEKIIFPVFENTQDIDALALKIAPALKASKNCFAVMLRDHGIYVWGGDVDQAKRHLEAFEYLFKFMIRVS